MSLKNSRIASAGRALALRREESLAHEVTSACEENLRIHTAENVNANAIAWMLEYE